MRTELSPTFFEEKGGERVNMYDEPSPNLFEGKGEGSKIGSYLGWQFSHAKATRLRKCAVLCPNSLFEIWKESSTSKQFELFQKWSLRKQMKSKNIQSQFQACR